MDRDQIKAGMEVSRHRLGGSGHEDRVGNAALSQRARSAARRLGQPRGIGVQRDGQRRRLGARERQREAAVAGSDIERRPLVTGGQGVELADVDVEEVATADDLHGAKCTRECRAAHPSVRGTVGAGGTGKRGVPGGQS
jgi:hypothetical protein